MHALEPYWRWRDLYTAETDELSPFYEREYSEFEFTNVIYNHVIHPQWDEIGSPTLYIKILFTDYEEGFSIIEMLGEWNDAIYNDIMYLKREILDVLIQHNIQRFILIGENVLNFHADSTDYYEELFDDIIDEGGWVALINFNDHVIEDMKNDNLHYYLQTNEDLQNLSWRKFNPDKLIDIVEDKLLKALK